MYNDDDFGLSNAPTLKPSPRFSQLPTPIIPQKINKSKNIYLIFGIICSTILIISYFIIKYKYNNQINPILTYQIPLILSSSTILILPENKVKPINSNLVTPNIINPAPLIIKKSKIKNNLINNEKDYGI